MSKIIGQFVEQYVIVILGVRDNEMTAEDALFLLQVVAAPALMLLMLAAWLEGPALLRSRRKRPGYSGQCKKLKG